MDSMIKSHRETWCWSDDWIGYNEESIRPLELSQIDNNPKPEVCSDDDELCIV